MMKRNENSSNEYWSHVTWDFCMSTGKQLVYVNLEQKPLNRFIQLVKRQTKFDGDRQKLLSSAFANLKTLQLI